jgi:hypothetical protein
MFSLPRSAGDEIQGIEVRGSFEFRARTEEALALLSATAALALVRAHVKLIRQGARSGMRAWANKPTFVVGRATWQHSPLWYAGAIAHDAYHAKLYAEALAAGGGAEPPATSWTGVDPENQCLAFQYTVLKLLHGDENTLRYVEQWAENPTYAGRAYGLGGWLDYLSRWW